MMFREGASYEKMAFGSEQYEEKMQEEREIQRDMGYREDKNIFCRREIENILFFKEMPLPNSKERIQKEIQNIRENWLEYLESGKNMQPLLTCILKVKKIRDEFCKQRVFNREVTSFLRNLKQRDVESLNDQTFLWFRHNVINNFSDDFVVECIALYQEDMNKKKEAFEKNVLPEIRKTVQEKLRQAVESGKLPISKEHLEYVFEHTDIVVGDPLIADFEELGGSFDNHGDVILLRPDVSSENAEKILTHEFMHALSGRTVFSKNEDEYDHIDFEKRRVGTHFFADTKSVFRWMNEAITELLTRDVLEMPDEKKSSYESERELLKFFLQKIDKSLFVNAYFEQFDPKAKGGERNPHWRILFKKIQEEFGEFFLNDLEKYIVFRGKQVKRKKLLLNGVNLVVDDWKAVQDDFPYYLQEWKNLQKEEGLE